MGAAGRIWRAGDEVRLQTGHGPDRTRLTFHGDRQWRCEAEQAGRILRGQAARKKQFALILPLLEQGMLLPHTEKKQAGKEPHSDQSRPGFAYAKRTAMGAVPWNYKASSNRRAISTSHTAAFPRPMKTCRPIPVLKVGILPYAADDGGERGQAYRLRIDLEGRCCYVAFRAPDQAGRWSPTWTEPQIRLAVAPPGGGAPAGRGRARSHLA